VTFAAETGQLTAGKAWEDWLIWRDLIKCGMYEDKGSFVPRFDRERVIFATTGASGH